MEPFGKSSVFRPSPAPILFYQQFFINFDAAGVLIALPEAYVLLNCDTGEEGDVLKELRAISGVSDVKVVFGIYDIIATLSADTDGDIKKTVAKIRMIGGIRSSITMMVVQEY